MDQPKPMTLDVFSEKTNAAVVRMPGCDQLAAGGDALTAARQLLAGLESLQTHYESVLSAHAMRLPYVKSGD
jgi:hypothetical protein